MMKFNEKLTESLSEEDRPLGELILFFVDRKINLYKFLEVKDGRVILAENIHEKVHEITNQFLENEILIADYPEGLIRLSPTECIFCHPKVEELEIDVDRIRNLFPKGQKSNKKIVEKLLKKFFKDNPEYGMDDVETATRTYIKRCNLIDRPIRDIDNFIYDDSESSMLLQWIEEIERDEPHSSNWRNKVI